MSDDEHQIPQRYEATPADSLVATAKMFLIDDVSLDADDVTEHADWLWSHTAEGAGLRTADMAEEFDPADEITPRELVRALVAEIARLVRPMDAGT